MSDFLNNLGKIGMVLQAGGGSLAGRDGMAVVRDWEKQQEDARKREAISGLLAQSGIGGIQRGLLEQLPVDQQAPAILNMLAQMEAQRRAAASAGAAKAKAAAEQEAMLRAYEAFAGGGQPAPTPAGNPYSLGMDRGDVMPPSQRLSFGAPAAPVPQIGPVRMPNDGSGLEAAALRNGNPASVVELPPRAPLMQPQEAPPTRLSFGEPAPRPPRSQMSPLDIAKADMANLLSPRALSLRGAPGSPTYKAWELAFADAERRAKLFEQPEAGNDYERYVAREVAAGRTPLDEFAYRGRLAELGRAPEGPLTLTGKINADLRAGRISEADAKLELERAAPQGMVVESDGQGGFRLVQGAGVGAGQKPFTEAQSKDNVYVTRMRGALEVLEPNADSLTSRWDRLAEMDPTGLARELQSPEFQMALQAGDEFLQALLRKDTGAAMTNEEQFLYGRTFLPRPGDGPEVLAKKAAARQRAIAAVESGMSPVQILAVERALGDVSVPDLPPEQGPTSAPAAPLTRDAFIADPVMNKAAQQAGVTVAEMWEIYQEQLGQ